MHTGILRSEKCLDRIYSIYHGVIRLEMFIHEPEGEVNKIFARSFPNSFTLFSYSFTVYYSLSYHYILKMDTLCPGGLKVRW